MKKFSIILPLIMMICSIGVTQKMNFRQSLSNMAQQLASNVYDTNYSMTAYEGYNMDCLKIINIWNRPSKLGVFHSSKGYSDNYNRLYATIQANQTEKYKILNKLSDRGSQGTIFTHQILNGSYLVAYQLQNHQHGNTYAIRYYQDLAHLQVNNFLYEYQIEQKVDGKQVRNIGTPSIESLQLTLKQYDQKFNQYYLKIKFHYSPDGSHDYPGYGYINLKPLRDFIDKNRNWIGGCKQAYIDWKGYTDINVMNAIRKIGVTGKIGQRDSFSIESQGKTYNYYLYEANLYADFDWKNWRILLYGQTENQAFPIPFVLDQVMDLANPHITVLSFSSTEIVFQLSFFLPSEGMQPQSVATSGQVFVKSKITL